MKLSLLREAQLSCFILAVLSDAKRRAKELKKFSFRSRRLHLKCWSGDFGPFARVLQSDSDHHILWPCRASVPGDVPVRGLWRKHHLCQRDSRVSQLPRAFTLAPQVQPPAVEPPPTSRPQMFLWLVPPSVHWSSLTTVGGGVCLSVTSTKRMSDLSHESPGGAGGDGDVNLCFIVHHVITLRWLLMLHNGNCDSSEASKLRHTGEAGGAQWQSRLGIQQPSGPEIFSSDWGWLAFQQQKHLEHSWRPEDLIEVFCQVFRSKVLVTWS